MKAQLGPLLAHNVLQVGVDLVDPAQFQIADQDEENNQEAECQAQTNRDLARG